MKKNKDKIILEKILKEISIVSRIAEQYTKEQFLTDDIAQRAISMAVINIGELTTVLSDDLKEANSHIPWKKIKGLRNIIVHRYEIIDFEDVWETATTDIPELEVQLCEILGSLNN